MVNFRIVVVRTTGEHDAVRAGLLHPCERFGSLGANVALERLVLGPGRLDGSIDVGLSRCGNAFAHKLGVSFDELDEQALLQMLLLIVG